MQTVFLLKALSLQQRLVVLALAFALSGCDLSSSAVGAGQSCEPYDGLQVFCDIAAPGDIAALPDESGLLISEFGHEDRSSGRISLLALDAGEVQILYDAYSGNDLKMPAMLWGDEDCHEPEQFSPRSIELSQRPSGRWQLLAVNHGQQPASIEMFELSKHSSGSWQLDWRGCVAGAEDVYLEDVSATEDGFVVTQAGKSQSWLAARFAQLSDAMPGTIWRWRLQHGLVQVEGIESSLYKGIVSANRQKRYYINQSGEDKIVLFDRIKRAIIQSITLAQVGQFNWSNSKREQLLVTSRQGGWLHRLFCNLGYERSCIVAFSVVELDINTLQQKELFYSDGSYFGGGGSAVRIGDQLFIGSFLSNRILQAPLHYGVAQ